MNCHASSRLYIRANGTVPCNCDAGEMTSLFTPNIEDLDSFDYVEDCFNGEPFVTMRTRLHEGVAPIDACESCFFFHPPEPFLKYGENGRLKTIEHIQIESSFLCGVDCEACVLRSTRTDPKLSALGDGPYELPLALFKKLVDDVVRAGVHVGEFAFCGRGEPLLHPEFTEMMRYAREKLPTTCFSVVTSGNAPYSEGLMLVDQLEASIDGGYPDSYEIYRKGGNLERVLNFLRKVALQRAEAAIQNPDAAPKPRICWRYILFEHNDSIEELAHAQRLASEIGVDEMLFMLTHTWNASKKYTEQRQIEELPEFQVFQGMKRTFSMVNEDTDIVDHWKKIGEKPRDERFLS